MKLTLAELENRISVLEDEIARITDIETQISNMAIELKTHAHEKQTNSGFYMQVRKETGELFTYKNGREMPVIAYGTPPTPKEQKELDKIMDYVMKELDKTKLV